MIYGYRNNQLVWRIWRHQRKPGRFVKEQVETGKQNIFYVNLCQTAHGESLLKGLRKLAKENGVRLSTKDQILCPNCGRPTEIKNEEKILKKPIYAVYCRTCRVYCSYMIDTATPKQMLREIFYSKLCHHFGKSELVYEMLDKRLKMQMLPYLDERM